MSWNSEGIWEHYSAVRRPFRPNNIKDCHGSYWDNQFRAFALLQNTNCIWHCQLNGSKNNEINIVGNLAEKKKKTQSFFSPFFTPLHNSLQQKFVWKMVQFLSAFALITLYGWCFFLVISFSEKESKLSEVQQPFSLSELLNCPSEPVFSCEQWKISPPAFTHVGKRWWFPRHEALILEMQSTDLLLHRVRYIFLGKQSC